MRACMHVMSIHNYMFIYNVHVYIVVQIQMYNVFVVSTNSHLLFMCTYMLGVLCCFALLFV